MRQARARMSARPRRFVKPGRTLERRGLGRALRHAVLQRAQSLPEIPEVLGAEPFRAAGYDAPSARNERLEDARLGARRGNVVVGAQKPQTDRYIGHRVVADLFKCGIEQILDPDRWNDDPHDVRRAAKHRDRSVAAYESDQDPPELIDAGDRGARIIDRRGHGLEGDVHDLNDAELDILSLIHI